MIAESPAPASFPSLPSVAAAARPARCAGGGPTPALAWGMLGALLALAPAAAVCQVPSAAPSLTDRAVEVHDGASDPAVSPDGRRIAASILGRIWVLPAEGGEATQLSFGDGWDTGPAWSPDGGFLAYGHGTPSGTDLVVLDLATGAATPLLHVAGEISAAAYAPDGRAIYYVDRRGQYEAHLWRVPVAGGAPTQLTRARGWHEWSFALSPDGSRVLLSSGRYGGQDLYTMQLPDSLLTRLTETRADESDAAWAADGTRYFLRTVDGVEQVVALPAGGAVERVVFTGAYADRQLALAPDGRSAVMRAARKLERLDLRTGATSPIPFTARFRLPARAPADLAIVHARLWDGAGAAVAPDATVLVRDGRIASVQRDGEPRVPAGVQVLDAKGRTLLPGLMDNHYHFWSTFQGPRLLMRGVTTIRDPGAPLALSGDLREAVDIGLVPGPHIYTAGPLIDGPGGYHPMVDVEIADSAAAPALVRALKAQGVDLLKVYFLLEPPVVRAVIREAKKQGLPVTGHIGVRTGWGEAMDAGIDGFNHVRVWRDLPPDHAQPDGRQRSLDASIHEVERMQADWTGIDPDGPAAKALLARMARTGTALDPTLTIQAVPDGARERLGLEPFARARDSYRKMSRFVKNAYEAGVPLLAGTDDGDLFAEMEAYAEAGIPNDAVLRSATVNGAEWLGCDADFGTIEPGKRADLIVVDGDPLTDMKTIRAIDVVVKDGRIVFRQGRKKGG